MNGKLDDEFYISQKDVKLKFSHGSGKRVLSFSKTALTPEQWRKECKQKLCELLDLELPASAGNVTTLRKRAVNDVAVVALVMAVSEDLSIPSYLLLPKHPVANAKAVIAIHGHGSVEPCIGAIEDYHHAFALELAKNGFIVLCPELRGFGVLRDLAFHCKGTRLDYWTFTRDLWNFTRHRAYSLLTDGFIHGKTLIGETIEDLIRWEYWLANQMKIKRFDVVGISYGGDLALIYPVFSKRVDRIFASGTLGSFSAIFPRCYNAPAHCIPGVLRWMDRSDIAGLNAPRQIAVHYGELDKEGPKNYSAAFNQTVQSSIQQLRAIYSAFHAESEVQLIVSKGKHHEMDNQALLQFLKP